GLLAGVQVETVVDLLENWIEGRDVHPLPVVPAELRCLRDVLRAEDRAGERGQRCHNAAVDTGLEVALGEDAAEEVIRLHAADLGVEAGGAQLLLKDLGGQLSPRITSGRGDGEGG